MNDFSYYGSKLKELRVEKGYTLREAASKLNLDYSHIGRIERGNFPSIPVLIVLLGLYDKTLSDFFNESKQCQWDVVIEIFESKGLSPEEIIKFVNVIGKLK